jgi:hypothetical protein
MLNGDEGMITVCVESPFAPAVGASSLANEFANNIAYARACLWYCLGEGCSPYASHLLLTQVYNDLDPKQRGAGIEAGWVMGDRCDERWFFVNLGIAKGMLATMDREKGRGKQIREVTLPDDWLERYEITPTPGFR